jgi:CBS domain-containing protein
MSAGRICVRSVFVGTRDESVADAARRMADNDVGTLVIVDGERRPVGVLTDRDIVVKCVARKLDPGTTPLSSVMTAPMVCVSKDTPIEAALSRMASVHVRRLAVTDREDRLVGLLAMDDVLELLIEETELIGRIVQKRHPQLEG